MAHNTYLFGDIEQIIKDLQQEYENRARLEMAVASGLCDTPALSRGAARGGDFFKRGFFALKKIQPVPLDSADIGTKIIDVGC
ncbi:hypothetical protein AGMMS49975_17700 [Clostridia bacterium]|nr:hypothetical protein AGMMS49975_17700 [Clostridia bacterium]